MDWQLIAAVDGPSCTLAAMFLCPLVNGNILKSRSLLKCFVIICCYFV